MKKKPKILMVGIYKLSNYGRGRIIYEGLKKNNADVDIFLSQGIFKYFKIMKRLSRKDYDAVLPNGKLVLLASKFMSWFTKKKIVFDVFISDYEALVESRKLVKENTLKAKILFFFDKYSCKWSDIVLLDTNEHIDYFVKKYELDKKKFRRVFVGGDDTIYYPIKKKREERKEKEKRKFTVLFYGSFIPGHGIKYILKAGKLLEKEKDIQFLILGIGQTYNEMVDISKELGNKNVEFVGWIDYKKIPEYISEADVCLGMFGDHIKKINRVIGNKIFEIIAMKKPLISGDCRAMREAFVNKENILFCKMDDEKSLAEAILLLKKNPNLREKIAENGYLLFKENFTTKKIGKSVLNIVEEIK
jgi:glycosyltransferase involved in cell wall biosynthesis